MHATIVSNIFAQSVLPIDMPRSVIIGQFFQNWVREIAVLIDKTLLLLQELYFRFWGPPVLTIKGISNLFIVINIITFSVPCSSILAPVLSNPCVISCPMTVPMLPKFNNSKRSSSKNGYCRIPNGTHIPFLKGLYCALTYDVPVGQKFSKLLNTEFSVAY